MKLRRDIPIHNGSYPLCSTTSTRVIKTLTCASLWNSKCARHKTLYSERHFTHKLILGKWSCSCIPSHSSSYVRRLVHIEGEVLVPGNPKHGLHKMSHKTVSTSLLCNIIHIRPHVEQHKKPAYCYMCSKGYNPLLQEETVRLSCASSQTTFLFRGWKRILVPRCRSSIRHGLEHGSIKRKCLGVVCVLYLFMFL